MNESASYPLIIRGPDSVLEIPNRLQPIPAIRDITSITRGRVSAQTYTIAEIGLLLERGDPIDVSHVPHLELMETIRSGQTTLIQLMAHKRWKILCLIDMVERGWSSLQTTSERQMGTFHTGSQLSFGHILERYLIRDNEAVEIPALLEKQKRQPDIIAWRDRTF